MSCPHGNGPATSCSQCAGAPAKRVAIVSGRVVIDGVDTGSTAGHASSAEEVMFAKPAARRGGRGHGADRHCGICGIAGHNRKSCRRG